MEEHTEEKKSYWPLIALFLVALLMGLALSSFETLFSFMRYWLGSFLCLLALVKLFDIKGFAMAFAEYDIIAKKIYVYGYFYPFLELGLGLAFFYGRSLFLAALVTLVLMIIGSLGVYGAMRENKKISCACMGSILKVPLTHVSLVEDLFMAIMALMLLTQSF